MKSDMDVSELQSCASCGKGVMHAGSLHFYEMTLTPCMIDQNSVRQLHGMEVMMGAAAPLARVLAPSTRVAVRMPPATVFVCSECALVDHNILELMEKASGAQ